MTFDTSKVYTAVNAEELKAGSKVIGADTLEDLKHSVKCGAEVSMLKTILPEKEQYRFSCTAPAMLQERLQCHPSSLESEWALVYLVEEPGPLKWTDLKIGDVIKHKDTGVEYMIIGIDADPEASRHVYFASEWENDKFLENWEKVEK